MANKYLEKIALLDVALGAYAADKGDKIGGAVSGGVLGSAGVITALKHAPHLAIPAALAGGYLGGKAYSRIKDNFRSEAEMKKHLERNKE